MNPVFSLEPDPKTVKLQTSSWSLIQQISGLIKIEADKERWDNVMILADKRERMVSEFFEKPLCMNLYETVIADIETMKEQHINIIENLAAHDNLAEIREQALRSLRAQAAGVSAAGEE